MSEFFVEGDTETILHTELDRVPHPVYSHEFYDVEADWDGCGGGALAGIDVKLPQQVAMLDAALWALEKAVGCGVAG